MKSIGKRDVRWREWTFPVTSLVGALLPTIPHFSICETDPTDLMSFLAKMIIEIWGIRKDHCQRDHHLQFERHVYHKLTSPSPGTPSWMKRFSYVPGKTDILGWPHCVFTSVLSYQKVSNFVGFPKLYFFYNKIVNIW